MKNDIDKISHEIYKNIHSKPYPGQPSNRDLSKERPYRRIHGFTSSCRAAAFLRIFLNLVIENRHSFGADVQKSLDEFLEKKEENIKRLQVVTLLRISGRDIDTNSGRLYAEKGKAAAEKYLASKLGWPKDEANDWAQCIWKCDPIDYKDKVNVTDIRTILLGDATTLDTFRDTCDKEVNSSFFFTSLLSDDDSKVSDDLNRLIEPARELICHQQLFCSVTYKGGSDKHLIINPESRMEKIVAGRPAVPNVVTSRDLKEQDEDCFSTMENEVMSQFSMDNINGNVAAGGEEHRESKGDKTSGSGLFQRIINMVSGVFRYLLAVFFSRKNDSSLTPEIIIGDGCRARSKVIPADVRAKENASIGIGGPVVNVQKK